MHVHPSPLAGSQVSRIRPISGKGKQDECRLVPPQEVKSDEEVALHKQSPSILTQGPTNTLVPHVVRGSTDYYLARCSRIRFSRARLITTDSSTLSRRRYRSTQTNVASRQRRRPPDARRTCRPGASRLAVHHPVLIFPTRTYIDVFTTMAPTDAERQMALVLAAVIMTSVSGKATPQPLFCSPFVSLIL